MATSSFFKEFVITDRKAFEQFRKDTESLVESSRKDKPLSSLEYGREKLKDFSFR